MTAAVCVNRARYVAVGMAVVVNTKLVWLARNANHVAVRVCAKKVGLWRANTVRVNINGVLVSVGV